MLGLVASRRKGIDAERVKGLDVRMFSIDASHVLDVVALRRKGIDTELMQYRSRTYAEHLGIDRRRAPGGLHDTGRVLGIGMC
jgi:hypothetical protein